MRRLILLALVPLALVVPAAAQAKTVTVKEAASDKRVNIDKGDVLRVYLEENAGTGYGWRRMTATPSLLRYRGTKYFVPPIRPGRPMVVGAPGHRAFRYKALKRGTGSFKLGLYPPGVRRPAKSYKLTVTVN